MQKLSRDSYTTRGRPAGQTRQDGLVLFAFLFASCALLMFSRLDLEAARWLRWRLVAVVQPLLETVSVPITRLSQAGQRLVASGGALTEVEHLRAENARLRAIEWRARELERTVAQLSGLARAAEATGARFASARVIADAQGPFAQSLLVGLGTRDGVQVGYAAIGADGLIGHVVDAGEQAARILLLGDPASRVPVAAGPHATQAILKGEGGAAPRLTGIAPTAPGNAGVAATLRDGDDVATSGDDGLLPRGLKVGTVKLEDEGPRVVLAASPRGLEFVAIVFFQAPQLIKPVGTASADTTHGKLEPTSGRRRRGAVAEGPGAGPGRGRGRPEP